MTLLIEDKKREEIKFPVWGKEVVNSKARYVVLHGGRGSGKSYLIAMNLILKAYESKQKILCCREHLSSLKYSVHETIKDCIYDMGLSNAFRILENEIICKHNGSKFFHAGLSRNVTNIKSIQGLTHAWIEEAATISVDSWEILDPTVRLNNSQVWISLNPENKEDYLYQRFVVDPNPEDAFVKRVNWDQNPYFTETLDKMRKRALKADHDRYLNVWEGHPIKHSDALIFKGKWVVDDFVEDPTAHAYYGLDFGFIDPTAAIRCYIAGNTLYVTHEYYKRQVEINNIGKECESSIEGFKKGLITADSASPGNISYLNNQGYNVKPTIKGKGSIEDGISFLRSFDRIVVHPRCENMRRELSLYSYKVEPRSKDILPIIIDSDNHLIDALRYAVERVMKNNTAHINALFSW